MDEALFNATLAERTMEPRSRPGGKRVSLDDQVSGEVGCGATTRSVEPWVPGAAGEECSVQVWRTGRKMRGENVDAVVPLLYLVTVRPAFARHEFR